MKSQHFAFEVTLESLIFLEFLCILFSVNLVYINIQFSWWCFSGNEEAILQCATGAVHALTGGRLWLGEEARPSSPTLLAAQPCLRAVNPQSGQEGCEADHIRASHLEGYCQDHSQIMTANSQGWGETSEPEGKLGEKSKPWGVWGRGRQASCWSWWVIFSRKASPLGQPCHAFIEGKKKVFWPLSAPPTEGERRWWRR